MGQLIGGATSTSGASKTKNLQSFFSSSTFTVPAGVTTLVVTCIGGGGGGGCAATQGANVEATGGGASSMSTLTASGGNAGRSAALAGIASGSVILTGVAGTPGTGRGGGNAGTVFKVTSGVGTGGDALAGTDGQTAYATLTVTPGASMAYFVGGGGAGGAPVTTGIFASGGAGASGRIDIEWYV